LTKLESLATKYQGQIAFVALNFDNKDKAKTMGQKWPHLIQLFIDNDTKKTVCEFFGLKFIPHAVLINKDRTVALNSGDFDGTNNLENYV